MSQVGRPAVPVWLKALRGTLVPGELDGMPQPDDAIYIPPPAEWAEERPIAREFWALHLPLLVKNRMLAEVDMTAFAMLCICFEELVVAEKELKEKGNVIKTENGYLVQSPYVSIAQQRRKEFAEYLREFGLTPSARTRIKIEIKPGGADASRASADQAFFDF